MRTPAPPVWFFGCLVAILTVHVVAPGPRWLAPPWTLVGIMPVGAGMALHAWATRAFRRAGTTTNPEGRPAALVSGGPYGWSRNPMYMAGVPILFGVVLLLGSIGPVSILLLYCVAAGRWVATEEGALRRRFGGEWDSYRGTVRRWI